MAASGNYIAESDVDNWPTKVDASEPFTTDKVHVANNTITVTTSNIATCTEIQFSSTGVVPAPLETGVIYYAILVTEFVIKVALTPVLAAVPTPIDLADQGSGTHTLDIGSGSSTVERQEVIDRAEQLIEKITKDYFYIKTFTIYRDGNGKDKLFLGLIPHILISTSKLRLTDLVMAKDSTTLTSETGGFTVAMVGEKIYISAGTNFIVGWYTIATHVDTNEVTLNKTAATAGAGSVGVGTMGGIVEVKLSGVELGASWYTYDIDSIYLDPEAVSGSELPELMLRLKYKTRLFPRGQGNIKITGTYGWSACPVAIKQTAIILCRYENDETLYTKYDDLVLDRLGDMSQSRGQKRFLTGVMEADRLVRNYIRKKPMLGVA